MTALEHYVQEATAFAVFHQLPESTKLRNVWRSEQLWKVIIAVIEELNVKLQSGEHCAGTIDAVVRVHPIMKRLLRRCKREALQLAYQALL